MFLITEKRKLTTHVSIMKIKAPYVVKNAKPGQFVILRVEEFGERIPMTIAEANKLDGTISIIYQIVGATTLKLDSLDVGDSLLDFVGPLGKASNIENLKKVAVIGGGVGCAIAYPTAKALYEQGTIVHVIAGFRSIDQVILENEFKPIAHLLRIMTDDGSYGEKGLVTNALKQLLDNNESYDEVIAIGPVPMMKYVSLLTKEYNIKTTVSMNSLMIDGTGMCGGCRITVNNIMKFACVDGPDFDGHKVDFDEVIRRNRMYEEFEKHQYESTCNLLKEVKDK